MNPKRPVATPFRESRTQIQKRAALASIDRVVFEPIANCELEIGHASSWIEREKGAVAVQWDDVDAWQLPDNHPIDHDERSTVGD